MFCQLMDKPHSKNGALHPSLRDVKLNISHNCEGYFTYVTTAETFFSIETLPTCRVAFRPAQHLTLASAGTAGIRITLTACHRWNAVVDRATRRTLCPPIEFVDQHIKRIYCDYYGHTTGFCTCPTEIHSKD